MNDSENNKKASPSSSQPTLEITLILICLALIIGLFIKVVFI